MYMKDWLYRNNLLLQRRSDRQKDIVYKFIVSAVWCWLLSWDTFVFRGLACGVLIVSFENLLRCICWLQLECRLGIGFIPCLLKVVFCKKPVKKKSKPDFFSDLCKTGYPFQMRVELM